MVGWDSGLEIMTGVTVYVPEYILEVCETVKRSVDGEFSILLKGQYEKGNFFILPEYYIPKQKVGYANVDFEEDLHPLRIQGWNTVLHKHPPNLKTFSTTDKDYINSHFTCSLLYCDTTIPTAIFNLKMAETGDIIQILPTIKIIKNHIQIPIEALEKITETATTVKRYPQQYNYTYNVGGYNGWEEDETEWNKKKKKGGGGAKREETVSPQKYYEFTKGRLWLHIDHGRVWVCDKPAKGAIKVQKKVEEIG